MMAVDALAIGARKGGPTRTAEEWIGLLGRAPFYVARRCGILVGPSGATMARCHRCCNAGHLAPVIPNRVRGDYDIFCEEAGISAAPASRVEGYRVDQSAFLKDVARACGVVQPETEFRVLGDDLFMLGRARLGKRPFSLIAAMNLQTEKEITALQRRNRLGFGAESGLILCSDRMPAANALGGFHSLCQYDDCLEHSDRGLLPRWSEIRRLLGMPGRPTAAATLRTEAQKTLQAIADDLGHVPKGAEAFELLGERRPDLAELSKATLYAAKRLVKRPKPIKNSKLQED